MPYEARGYICDTAPTPVAVDISRDRYQEIKLAKATCLGVVHLEELLALLLENYSDWECELLGLAQAHIIKPSNDFADAMQQRLLLNKRLINFLTVSRLYFDHSNHIVSKYFNDTSSEATSIKAYKNKLYDDHFGYRLIEALRNHALHCAFPVNFFSQNSRSSPCTDPSYEEVTIIPILALSAVRENKDFHAKVLNELNTHEENLDLRPPIREHIQCVLDLHNFVRDTFKVKLKIDRSIYLKAIDDYSMKNGHVINGAHIVHLGEDGMNIEKVDLTHLFIDYHDFITKKYEVKLNMNQSFASNSTRKRP
jgi:hypothetical protein